MNQKNWLIFIFILITFCITSCVKDLPPGNYEAAEVGKLKKVMPGVIISKRPIWIYSNKPDLPFSDNFGNVQDGPLDQTKRKRGFEYVVKLNNGEIVSIAQDEDLKLKSKQHVLLIYGTTTRIVADDGSDDV
jgi:outer membrane lipoprotein SlyB